MPRELEAALMKAYSKKGAKRHGKTAKEMTYATMTNLQKRGSIPPWRKLERGPSA